MFCPTLKAIVTLFLFISFNFCFAQNQELFLDVNGKSVAEAKAFYKRQVNLQGDSAKVSQYYMSGKLYFEGYATYESALTDELSYIGNCKWFYKNGQVKESRSYNGAGELNGSVKKFTEEGKLISEATYVKGQLQNSGLKEFDEDGRSISVFKESFDNNENDWDLFESDYGLASIEEGKLTIGSKTTRGNSRLMYRPIDSRNFSIEVDLTHPEKDNGAIKGILFNFKDWDNYSYFYLDGRYFSVGRLNKGIVNKAVDLFGTPKANASGTNNLKILFEDGIITYSINSEVVYKQKSYEVKEKYIGFVAGGKGNMEVDNFVVKTFGSTSNGLSDQDVRGSGTGFMVNQGGYLITNYHVVDEASSIYVEFTQGPLAEFKQFEVKAVIKDENSDLALLQIVDTNFSLKQGLPYSFSKSLKNVGNSVFSLGYPLVLSGMGSEVKFTDGRISARTGYDNDISSYQTSVPIQPGNSGSPLFDESGKVVGCVNAVIREADNVSYAIKTTYIQNIMQTAGLETPVGQDLSALSLEDKIKLLSNYIAIIKVR